MAQGRQNYAALLRKTNREEQASKMEARAKATREESSWEMSMDAATEAYQQARYTEAEKFFLAALEEADNFGPQDPRLVPSLNGLASVYRTQGKHAEAEPLFKRSLAIREEALGPEHFDVALGLHNLALTYDSQGKYAEAEPLYKRALAIGEKALGPEHPYLAAGLEDYAALLQKMNREAEATQMESRAKAMREKAAK